MPDLARGRYGLLRVPSFRIPVDCARYAFRRRPRRSSQIVTSGFGGVGLKRMGGGIDFMANCSNYHPIRDLTDVHSSVFRLAWCLLKSTRSARFAFETE